MPAGRFSIAAPIYPAAKNNFTLRGAGLRANDFTYYD